MNISERRVFPIAESLRLELESNNLLLFTYLYTTTNYLYYLNSYSQLQKLSNLMHPNVAKR